MSFDGVIFDLDGTLIDSMHCWENIDKAFLLENGIEPPPGVSDVVKKMTIEESALYFKTQFSLEQSCEDISDRIEEMVRYQYFHEIPLKEGAYETVMKLYKVGVKMCVATATYKPLACAALERLGILDCFEFVINCTDVGCGKDRPDIFIESAKKLGCDISRTAVAEDSLHCIESAVAAGFRTIAVYDDISSGEWEDICHAAWKNVRTPGEIAEIIMSFSA